MGLYKLVLAKQVRKKDLPKIAEKPRLKILKIIEGLQSDPRPKNALRLTNREEYRIRHGDYRILYLIEDEVKIVQIEHVGHRGEVYRKP